MLDVHAPHGNAHTWKDFFIHIATITIGLLIAIGLEQTVEYVHHSHQATLMAEKLRAEGVENREISRRDIAACNAKLATLREVAASLDDFLRSGGRMPWIPPAITTDHFYAPSDAVWMMLRDSALLQFMPRLLVENYWKIAVSRDFARSLGSETIRGRLHLNSLVSVYAGTSSLSRTDATALRLALAEYTEQLLTFREMLARVRASNKVALENQVISPESIEAAVEESDILPEPGAK